MLSITLSLSFNNNDKFKSFIIEFSILIFLFKIIELLFILFELLLSEVNSLILFEIFYLKLMNYFDL